MSTDVTLQTAGKNGLGPDRFGHVSYFADHPEHTCLFWMCCFRLKDLTGIGKYRSYMHLCCEFEIGMTQFQEGMATINRIFPETNSGTPELESYIARFLSLLGEQRDRYLVAGIGDLWPSRTFRLLLQHCLAGFDDPDCKHYYDNRDRLAWDSAFPPPAESGIMDWRGALRRMFCPYISQDPWPVSQFDDASGDLMDVGSSFSLGRMLFGRVDDLDYENEDG